jgi:alpha-mannosidase
MSKPNLYIIINNHFDLTWRRCWDRHFRYEGEEYISYADIEAYYLLDNLVLARQNPEYKFEAESAMVVRKFLQRHPEALEELQALSAQGRFAVTGGGENIIDANMVHGESLVRNFVSGLLWVEKTFGRKTRLAVRNDAFGNSAQLPQILRGVEIAWCTGFSYTPAQGSYWRGLDGSTILHTTLPVGAQGGGVVKYAPCKACHGSGCSACHGRGIDDRLRAMLPGAIQAAALDPFNAALILIIPEEYLPNPDLIGWAKAQTEYEVCFALQEDVMPYLQPLLENVDHPPMKDLHPALELNPNNSGVLATRIATKQNVRRHEYALLAVEALAVFSALRGRPYPQAALSAIWLDLFFTQFHDAITATHVDPAYAEIKEFWRKIDRGIETLRDDILADLTAPAVGKISVLNLCGDDQTQLVTAQLPQGFLPVTPEGKVPPLLETTPVAPGQVAVTFLARNVPAFGKCGYTIMPTALASGTRLEHPRIENQRFRIEADSQGLLSIYDQSIGKYILQSDEYHPGELILEHDEGSPWATLHPDQTRIPLAQFTRLARAEQGMGFQRLVFEFELPWSVGFASRGGVKGEYEVILVEGLERVDFRAKLHWATFNHRLRVAFPVPFRGRHMYGIPYGALERQPYQPWFAWAGANGDWPAVNWGGVQNEAFAVAVLNKGTPSYRMEASKENGEVILLTILRSPAIPTYLHEPEFYSMMAYDGMRDEGDHAFEYALTAYGGAFAQSQVVADAEGYNGGLLAVSGEVVLPEMPLVQAENVRLAAIKGAEDGSRALILRLVEFRGQAGSVLLRLPEGIQSVAKVNLLERGGELLSVKAGEAHLTLRAWEIATLRLEYS